MKKYKWRVALSLATVLLGNITPAVLAEDISSIAMQIDSELRTHQVKDGDKLPDIAQKLGMDADLLKTINSRSKFKLTQQGNWAVLHKKRYLILSDAHFHDYAIYDLETPDKDKDLPYSKMIATDELKQLVAKLHDKLGHIDGDGHHHHDHDHDHSHHGHHHHHHGHDHSHHGHHHHHHGHDHSHHGHHDHNHHGHDHSHHGHHDHNHHGHHDHEHELTDFRPEDIVSEDENGYIIKHGDHFHYVPKKKQPQVEQPATPNETPKPNEPQPNSDEKPLTKPENGHTPELEAKLNYIAVTHGVPKESIIVSSSGYFVFSTPAHDYDPTHIHPVAIPIDRILVPEVTGDPETDFENELKAMSHLTGIPVFALKIENNKFLIPHADHAHYLNIIATNGIKPYLDSLLPAIKGSYVPGELNIDAVKNKVTELVKMAEERYKDNPKQVSRIKLALDAFNFDLSDLPNNSTQGYINMLDQFNQQYISKNDAPSSTDTPATNEAFNKKYNELSEKVRQLDLNGYSITRDDLIARLRKANDEATLNQVGNFIEELNHAKPTRVFAMKYLDYFLANLEKPHVSNELREEMSELISLSFRAQFSGRKYTAEQLMDRLIDTRHKLQESSEKNEINENRVDGEHYHTLVAEKNNTSPKNEISKFLGEVRDFIQSFDSKFVPNVTPEEAKETPVADEKPKEESNTNTDSTNNESEETTSTNDETSNENSTASETVESTEAASTSEEQTSTEADTSDNSNTATDIASDTE
ncbi:pneumococcal-type histidine triad protein [Aerococcaceae bacterium NML190938]|nr:pneumococcal-type histidine triad protein [Aerococcaceae bacterium NML190938]